MKNKQMINESFFDKVSSSINLLERNKYNKLNCDSNFDCWVDELFKDIGFSRVLDVCCGTGNQLIKFASNKKVELLIGIDLSEESLKIASERISKNSSLNVILRNISMEKLCDDEVIKRSKIDFISCFYGLYYSKDVENTLNQMFELLPIGGSIVVAGPYGKNNYNFFELLQKRFRIPEFVLKSSTTFMQEVVFPLLLKKADVCESSFVNKISFFDTESLYDYWKATTFYFPEYKDIIFNDINSFFKQSKEFVIEKHVLAYVATKKL